MKKQIKKKILDFQVSRCHERKYNIHRLINYKTKSIKIKPIIAVSYDILLPRDNQIDITAWGYNIRP